MPDNTAIIAEIADRQAITDLLLAYCGACDRCDERALNACFHPESTHDHGGYCGPSREWVAPALTWLQGRTGITHMIATPRIVVLGDNAVSDCHFVAYNRLAKDADLTEEVLVKGRYVDRLVRTAGGWKIIHRIGIHDLELVRDIPTSERPDALGPKSGTGAHDPFTKELAALLAS